MSINQFEFYILTIIVVLIIVLIISGSYLYIYLKKNAKDKQQIETLKKQLEIEAVINYFTKVIQPKTDIDDIVWSVAKDVIHKLDLTDFVIYLWNDDKTLLLQKAAFGNKNTQKDIETIVFTVQLGEGVVGNVATSKEIALINDTSKDPRYRVDEESRVSELAVPIIYNNQLIGVLDSEHETKNFYTQHHINLFKAIATLIANKLIEIQQQATIAIKETMLYDIENKLLRAQMNPHFIFNSLNAILYLITKNKTEEASKYLLIFSKLQRNILNLSTQKFIPLQKEIEILDWYLSIEKMRFQQHFNYSFELHNNMDDEEIVLPPMLLQPLLENAIWHGLLPKINGEKTLNITFDIENDEYLICTIIDNGIGRKQAAINRKIDVQKSLYQSKGMNLIENRLQTLSKQYKNIFELIVIDLYNGNNPIGTKIILKLYIPN
jgi:two-component system, LytTR family, sensor kinase